MRRSLLIMAVLLALAEHSAACGSNSTTTSPTSSSIQAPADGVAQFTVIPVDLLPPGGLTALGSLNPPGHVLPTDHVYFYPSSLAGPSFTLGTPVRNVRAPATGVLQFVLQQGSDAKLTFKVTSTFSYYLDHVIPNTAMQVGALVRAGDIVGTSTTTLDLGAYDYATTLGGLITPTRYPDETLHCVSPWKYFVEPLRSQLYALIYRTPSATDKDGKIDFDMAGRLAGGWFDSSLPKTNESAGPTGWPKTVGFVYDYFDPTQVRISIGGTIAPAGVWAIETGAPRPEAVTVESGKVSYRLMRIFDPSPIPYGLMLVQMMSTTEIRIEVFVGNTSFTGDFDTNARTYIR